ncbi:MAG TPA: pullulanase-associated domain-containing protein, partial [Actinomycetota bacterium]
MDPLRPTGQDVVGIVFRVPLVDGGDQLAYILHRGDTKDPGPDQFLVSANYGHEVWRLQGRRPGEA